jgi:hypothetical protein
MPVKKIKSKERKHTRFNSKNLLIDTSSKMAKNYQDKFRQVLLPHYYNNTVKSRYITELNLIAVSHFKLINELLSYNQCYLTVCSTDKKPILTATIKRVIINSKIPLSENAGPIGSYRVMVQNLFEEELDAKHGESTFSNYVRPGTHKNLNYRVPPCVIWAAKSGTLTKDIQLLDLDHYLKELFTNAYKVDKSFQLSNETKEIITFKREQLSSVLNEAGEILQTFQYLENIDENRNPLGSIDESKDKQGTATGESQDNRINDTLRLSRSSVIRGDDYQLSKCITEREDYKKNQEKIRREEKQKKEQARLEKEYKQHAREKELSQRLKEQFSLSESNDFIIFTRETNEIMELMAESQNNETLELDYRALLAYEIAAMQTALPNIPEVRAYDTLPDKFGMALSWQSASKAGLRGKSRFLRETHN